MTRPHGNASGKPPQKTTNDKNEEAIHKFSRTSTPTAVPPKRVGSRPRAGLNTSKSLRYRGEPGRTAAQHQAEPTVGLVSGR